ncbi:hypothetical protein GCM10022259_42020 [Aquimarina mytili]
MACSNNTKSGALIDDADFKITQKFDYKNPHFDDEQPGPVFNTTYIDDPQIKTLGDLNRYYPLQHNLEPTDFEAPYYSKNLFYKVAILSDSIKIPVITDNDGLIYDFLIEDGWLTANTLVIKTSQGKKEYIYPTLEIEKRQ